MHPFRTIEQPLLGLTTPPLCTPDRTRTCNLWFRRPLLYPVELRVHANRTSLPSLIMEGKPSLVKGSVAGAVDGGISGNRYAGAVQRFKVIEQSQAGVALDVSHDGDLHQSPFC